MASRKSPQTNLRLSYLAMIGLDELVSISDVSTTKSREVELAIFDRLAKVKEGMSQSGACLHGKHWDCEWHKDMCQCRCHKSTNQSQID